MIATYSKVVLLRNVDVTKDDFCYNFFYCIQNKKCYIVQLVDQMLIMKKSGIIDPHGIYVNCVLIIGVEDAMSPVK